MNELFALIRSEVSSADIKPLAEHAALQGFSRGRRTPLTCGQFEVNKALKRGPVVLSFYRGGWCVYCSLELRALQLALGAIRARGAELVAITPQRSKGTTQTVDDDGLEYPILTDVGNRIGEMFGLTYEVSELIKPLFQQAGIDLSVENESLGHRLPITATYVVDTSGKIVAAFTDPNHFHRMEPDDIIAAIPG